MEQIQNCPNCKEPLKNGFFGSNQTNQQIGNEINQGNKELRLLAKYIPVVTTPHPYNWEYTIIGMVTAQSTTGTGVLSELTSSITDFFGSQSGAYNTKLKNGELLCFEQLRAQAIAMHGNAIIGTDIDYAEVGGDKGMLMICMAGTVIRLKNVEVLDGNAVENFNKVTTLATRLAAITPSFNAYNK